MASAALIQEQQQQLSAQSYYPENVAHNAKQVEYVRSTALSVAGGVAGVIGLTNFLGFGFYTVSVLLVNLLVLGLNAHLSPSTYFVSPPAKTNGDKLDPRLGSFSPVNTAAFLLQGLTENAFSFILWWTFWYGIVHVYD